MAIGEKFDSKILDQIKEKQIRPKARWIFVAKDYMVWLLGLLSFVLGALVFSVIIFLIKNNDWEMRRELSGSLIEFIFLTLPYFWIVFLAIFVFAVSYNLKHTRKGYKFSLLLVVPISILASILLGALFFGSGLGRAIDDELGRKAVFYEELFNPMVRMWDKPGEGRLSGMIVARIEDQQYRLLDISREEWLIDISQAEIARGFVLEIGRPVKLLGQQEGEYFFLVKRLFYHEGPGRGMMHRLRDQSAMPQGYLPKSNCPLSESVDGEEAAFCPHFEGGVEMNSPE
jgi:heme/copper-type cytochrome/quinol oxidase subunit 2